MKRDDCLYLEHILEAMDKIYRYTLNLDYPAFVSESLIQDGVIRQLEIMGEATKNISIPTRDLCPDIPWKDIAGMRDILIHQYFGVDLHAVWDTAREDIPPLRGKIEQLIQNLKC